MNYVKLMELIKPILPNASLGEDNEGQLIIYTDMSLDNYEVVPWDGTWPTGEDDDDEEV